MRSLGEPCIHVRQVDSTNDALQRMLRQDESLPEGTVLFADRQSAGRGRHGRQWRTMEGALACSVLLRPDVEIGRLPQISLLTAVAVRQVVSPLVPGVAIKWPNDILIDGRKVCGILTETHVREGRVRAVIVGVGLNIRAPRNGWPADIAQPATSIEEWTRSRRSREQWLACLLDALQQWYGCWLTQGFAPVRAAWMEGFAHRGRPLRVRCGGLTHRGVAEGLAEDGALLLRVGDDLLHIASGDVEMAR